MSVARTLEELLYQLSRRVLLIERRLAVRGGGGGGSGGVTPQPPASVSASLSTAWPVPSGAASPPWNSVTLTGGWIKTGNGLFTAPADGWVQVDAVMTIDQTGPSAGNCYVAIFHNGVNVGQAGERVDTVANGGATWESTVTKGIKVVAGDTLEIRYRAQASGPLTPAAATQNFVTMHYVTVGAPEATSGGDLPDRLGITGRRITDFDSAIEDGWYWGESPANAPFSSTAPWLLTVSVVGPGGTYPGRITQEVTLNTSDTKMRKGKWTRWWQGTSWSAWRQVNSLSGVVAITTSGGAIYKDTPVTFPTGFFPVPPNVVIGTQVNTSGNSLVSQAQSVTAGGFTARTATTQATAWTATYNIFWVAVPDPS